MMHLQTKRSRLIELVLLFVMILVLFLLSLLAPTNPNPPTPWKQGEISTPSPTPTSAPAWWQACPPHFHSIPPPQEKPMSLPPNPDPSIRPALRELLQSLVNLADQDEPKVVVLIIDKAQEQLLSVRVEPISTVAALQKLLSLSTQPAGD